MIKDMKKYIYIIASVLALTAVSCTEKLDSVEQLGALGTDPYYANANDSEAEALISSIYTSVWGQRITNSSVLTDDVVNNNVWKTYNNDTFLSGPVSTAGLSFTTLYQINYKANMIIEKLKDDTAAKKRVIAEAYFLRAWAYYYLIMGWGTPPLVDHVLGSDELQPANGNTEELWNYVQTSLDEAIKGLPTKSGLGGQRALGARVTAETAKAWKGKAYLAAGDKANAATYLKQVIDSGKYKLLDEYFDLYTLKGDWCDEYLWEFNASDADDDMRATEARMSHQNYVWRAEYVTMPGGVHLTGFNQGYEQDFPSKSFYDFLVARGEIGTKRQKGNVWTFEEAADKFIELAGDEYKDSPNYEGDNVKPLLAKGMSEKQAGMYLLWGGFVQPLLDQCQGYLGTKFYFWHSDMYTATNDKDLYSKANFAFMRYADVLLLYAEATVDSQAGLAAFNQVRTRAGMPTVSSYTLKDVQDERRAEFFFEGERFWDCRRWGIDQEAFKEVGKYTYKTAGDPANYTVSVTSEDVTNWVGYDTKYRLFPYPTTELTANPNLVQNPGW